MAEPSDPAKTPDKTPDKAADKAPDKTTDKTPDKKPEKKPATAAGAGADKKDAAKTDGGTKSSSVPGGKGKPADSQAKSESSGGGGRAFVFLLVVIILLGGGGYVTRDLWMAEVEPYLAKLPGFGAGSQEAAKDEPSPVDLLRERVASLEKSMADTSGTDGVMTALKEEKSRVQAELDTALARIDDLEKRLAEVRSLASAVTSGAGAEVDLEPIMSRIDGLERKDRETSGEVAALSQKLESIASQGSGSAGSGIVLAVAQLRDAALSGRPYEAQLDALKSVAAGNTEIIAAASRLNSGADSGLPTLDALQTRFSSIAGDVVAQARIGEGDWLDQAAGRLSALVSLRRTDGSSGDPVEDAIAGIESDLAARDIGSAVKTGSALADILEGEAKSMFEPWLLDAKARATAERALDAMHASALAALEK